jgi:prepilin-type processing-associated H-X9-DG protein
MNNMKQIALALQGYHRANGCFPPAYLADRSGKPIHSWRVLILPYVEGAGPLYKQYNFSEPWDGPNNKKLLARRPKAFACPGEDEANPQGATETTYIAVVGANAAWQGERPRTLGDFRGAGSETIMLVEATEAGIQWTEPKDLSLDALAAAVAKPPAVNVSSQHGTRKSFYFTYSDPAGANVALADGSVQFLPPAALAPNVLPKLLKIGGCTDENIARLSAPVIGQRQPNWDNIVALAVWLLSVGWLFYRAVRSRKRVGELAVAAAGGTEAPANTDKNGSDQ